MRNNLLFTILLLFSGLYMSAQIDMKTFSEESDNKNNSKLTKVTNEIYMLQNELGGNIAVYFGKDGTFLVDSQSKETLTSNLKIIKRISKKPIQFVVNSSNQFDHVGGNSLLKKEGAVIFSQEIAREEIINAKKGDQKNSANRNSVSDITFSNDLNFYFNKEKIIVVPMNNSNSKGNAIVYFSKSNVLVTGDIFIKGSYPFIDVENGGSTNGTLRALSKIVSMTNSKTKIIPGHGGLATITDLVNTQKMLELMVKQVYMNRQQGKTLEEVLNLNLTRKHDAKGFDKGYISSDAFIKTIYDEAAIKMGPLDRRTPEEKAADRLKEMQLEKEKEAKEKREKN